MGVALSQPPRTNERGRWQRRWRRQPSQHRRDQYRKIDDVTGVPFFAFLDVRVFVCEYEAAILISHLLSVVDADETKIRME